MDKGIQDEEKSSFNHTKLHLRQAFHLHPIVQRQPLLVLVTGMYYGHGNGNAFLRHPLMDSMHYSKGHTLSRVFPMHRDLTARICK